jgi:Zn-dependent protease
MQNRAFRELGVLGRPLPPVVLEKLKVDGRIGTAPERDALQKAGDVGPGGREGQKAMLEALRLRAMAKKLRAEADLAEVELANEKVNGTMRSLLAGVDVGVALLNEARGGMEGRREEGREGVEVAMEVARQAFARVLGLEVRVPPPLSTVERRATEVDHDEEDGMDGGRLEGGMRRPSWVRGEDMWDEDMPDLSIGGSERGRGKRREAERERDVEDSALMGRGGEKGRKGGREGGREDVLSARVQDDFIREVERAAARQGQREGAEEGGGGEGSTSSLTEGRGSTPGAAGDQGAPNGTGAPPSLSAGGEEEETYYTLSPSPSPFSSSPSSPPSFPLGGNQSDASDLGLIAYELIGSQESIPGMPDVVFRRIRRKALNPDESFQRAMGALQRMIETEEGGEEGGRAGGREGGRESEEDAAALLAQSLNPPPAGMNLTALRLEETDAGKVKDGLLESFLQSIFPGAEVGVEGGMQDGEVAPVPEHVWKSLRTEVFGKTAGGAFLLNYVVDFDAKFHVMVGEVGTAPSGVPLNTPALREVLNQRLEYFNLTDAVSLFFLRFPPETLFALEDIAMDAAMDQFDEDGGPPEVGSGGRGTRPGDGDLSEEELMQEGLDLRLIGELIPRFLGKLAQGRFAILAVSKGVVPDDSSVLDDPLVRVASLGMGALLQTSETLRFVSPPLFERLDRDFLGFWAHVSEFPAVTVGIPPVLLPFAGLIAAHEAGHYLAARRFKMALGPLVPLLDPWFGYLGSLTQLKSYPPTRQAFFDVAAAGPLLGSLVSYGVFGAGLWLTKLGALPAGGEFAPALPLALLQASTFVAEMTNAILPGAFAVVDPGHAALTLHPLALAGYWGVMFNALNLLPMGRLDGARMVEALLGRRTAAAASTFTFWGTVAAGIWQGRLDLFFAGLVVRFFWSRKAVPCMDEVEEVGGERYFLGMAGLILMLGALIPATSHFAGDSTYLLNNL